MSVMTGVGLSYATVSWTKRYMLAKRYHVPARNGLGFAWGENSLCDPEAQRFVLAA